MSVNPKLKAIPQNQNNWTIMDFCIWGRPYWIQDGKLNTLVYFLFFWLLVYWTWVENLRTFQILHILKKRFKFTLRWLLDLGNTSLEQNIGLKTLGYLLFIPAIFVLMFGCSMAKFWLLLIKKSTFGLSIFGSKVTWRRWVSTPNWVPIGP